MTRISYEAKDMGNDKTEITMKIEGKGCELFKGLCRLMNEMQKKLNMDDEKFESMIKDGRKIAKMESSVNNDEITLENLGDMISELIGLLGKNND